jgi:hypothetical protein
MELLTAPATSTHNRAAHIYVPRMKTNITLKLDSEILRQVRIIAAEEGSSISALLALKLQELVRQRKSYARAKARALARLRSCTDHGWVRPASRDELHER